MSIEEENTKKIIEELRNIAETTWKNNIKVDCPPSYKEAWISGFIGGYITRIKETEINIKN